MLQLLFLKHFSICTPTTAQMITLLNGVNIILRYQYHTIYNVSLPCTYMFNTFITPSCYFSVYHPQELADGSPYRTTRPLKCQEQADAFLHLLQEMAKRPQEYVTANERITTNSIEGFHSLALKYRGKKIDLHHVHYVCKTNMAICHKVKSTTYKVM